MFCSAARMLLGIFGFSAASSEISAFTRRRTRCCCGASVEATAELGGGLALTGGVTRVGSRADRDFTTYPATRVVLPAYTLLSLGATWQLLRRAGERPALELDLLGENLLNQGYQEVFGFRAPGRALYVGVRVGLGGGARGAAR